MKFWKPYGVLNKFTDAEGRPTLKDYIDAPNVYSIGRLDMDSEGLLLLTDHDPLVARLLDPKFAHPRTYWAQVERIPDEAALHRLRKGVELSESGKTWRTRPAGAELLAVSPELPERIPPIRVRLHIPTAWIALTLTEGKNRQVRRMTAAVGYPTLRLVRVSMDVIALGGLTSGAWQWLMPDEIDALWRSAFNRPPPKG